MNKRKRKPAKHRRPIRPRKRRVDPNYWPEELERRLNKFGASTFDLPDLDPESCTTEKQHQHAVQVRARFLSRRIRKIEEGSDGEAAERLFGDLMDRAGLIEEAPAWFVIDKSDRKSRSSASG